jgi:hypothetical protein
MESQAARTPVGERDERARRSELGPEPSKATLVRSPCGGDFRRSIGLYAVSASADQTLKVWELENGRALRALQGKGRLVQRFATNHPAAA